MALSKKSIAQAEAVMGYLKMVGEDTVRTKSKLYRIIELTKWPGLVRGQLELTDKTGYKHWQEFPFDHPALSRHVYGGEQYKPIEQYLIDEGYLTRLALHVGGSKYVYYYFVNSDEVRAMIKGKFPRRSAELPSRSISKTYFEQCSEDPLHYFHNM